MNITAVTTRQITFAVPVRKGETVNTIKSFPAGTAVELIKAHKNGTVVIRVNGTWFEQAVMPSAYAII